MTKLEIILRAKEIIRALRLPEGGGVAMDKLGGWWWYSSKPSIRKDYWTGEIEDMEPLPASALDPWPDHFSTSWITLETSEEVEG